MPLLVAGGPNMQVTADLSTREITVKLHRGMVDVLYRLVRNDFCC